ncbi:SDR family NAD(P)-dependent oxidoreductase [Flavitalea sp. BT771]|uniref:SDR family NAD(P)-dependent oxidoreductase n=1 Tax=Flavitalea sp. BT771 TaxID=3063329 RepID=UPI0026E45650|nr:SDR family NAD(P)-dependent oxidoreductase [Flavitalea sp. BT771]MDO6429566.1 SDR family NAD(P)-dependent oxidoreductase [Flavitalea sp. BT771]MDV6218306.1 SDR family NAD(P)-dependent oxidoreductase [Flavitalea sp. BT771]
MKTALVTGANKSIGFETVRQLLKKDYYVYLGSRDREKGQLAVSRLHAEGLSQVEAVVIDVSDAASVEKARQTIAGKSASLDLLINNAGISGGFPQPPSTFDTAAIREVFDTNFFGAIEVTRAFMHLLGKSSSPVIVNVTSGLASLTLHSDPSWMYYEVKGAAYGPSKTALNAYTVALAHELRATAFRVNAVDPGYTATDFNHHRGRGSVEAAAAFVVKYATIGADGPTGRFFSLDYQKNGNESPW